MFYNLLNLRKNSLLLLTLNTLSGFSLPSQSLPISLDSELIHSIYVYFNFIKVFLHNTQPSFSAPLSRCFSPLVSNSALLCYVILTFPHHVQEKMYIC